MNTTQDPEQGTLFTLPPEDHINLIFEKRQRRDKLRKLLAEQFARRLECVNRLNEAEAALDDAMDDQFCGRDDAKARLDRIMELKGKRDRVRADFDAAMERQKEIKRALDAAVLDVELAVGGIQRDLIEVIEELEPEFEADEPVVETAKTVRTARQRDVAERAARALIALGGRASCVDLASLVGVSSHGLGGLIDSDPRFVKSHEGRVKNLQTWYELAKP